jgi:multidrug efflux system membrane fusion protein
MHTQNDPVRPARTAKAAILVSLAAALAACGGSQPPDGKGGPGGAPMAPPVTVAAALERNVSEWDEFVGRLEAIERVELRPRVSGYIEKIHYAQGAEVARGDLLFEIDARPFEQELRRADAALASAKTRLDLAAGELARVEKLVESGAVSRQEVDERASARRDAESSFKSAQAALETANLNLGYTKVRAPVSGRTGKAELTVGNYVNAGQSVLTTLVSLDPIYVSFEADEQAYLKYSELSRRAAGSRAARNTVYMGLANETGYPHKGAVEFVDNRINPTTGTILARAVFDNRERRFTPGLFARVKLSGAGSFNAVLIDDKAVGTDQSKRFVLVVGADNKAMYREVRLGPLVDNLRVVREGLKPGENIVVNGLQRVRPGMPVQPNVVPMDPKERPKPAPVGPDGKPAAPAAESKEAAKPEAAKSAAGK